MADAEEVRRRQRERRDYLKAHGRCVRCGTRDERTASGFAECERCAAKRRAYMTVKLSDPAVREAVNTRRRDQSRAWRAAGLCSQCGKPAMPGRSRCRECLIRAAEAAAKYHRAKKEAGGGV